MSNINQIASDLYKVISESDEGKVKPYDTKAEVLRVEGNTAWVKIPGGIDETPVQMTNNANSGDTVMVRVAGGRAWLLGNNTSPATDDSRANEAYDVGAEASTVAGIAIKEAGRAAEAANNAELEAGRAKAAADEVHEMAERAEEDAGIAKTAANQSLTNLSQVQNVLDVVNWVAAHGSYIKATTYIEGTTYYTIVASEVTDPSQQIDELVGRYYEYINDVYVKTTDTEYDDEKTYYTVTGTPVANPKSEDINLYYILNVTDAMGDYILTHLALTNDGLYVMAGDSKWKVLVADDGVYIIDPNGDNVAKYKDVITIGKDNGTEGAQVIDYHSIKMYDRFNTPITDDSMPYFWVSDLKTESPQIYESISPVDIGTSPLDRYWYYFGLSDAPFNFYPVSEDDLSIVFTCNGEEIELNNHDYETYSSYSTEYIDTETGKKTELIIYFDSDRPALKNETYTIRYHIINGTTILEEKEVNYTPTKNDISITIAEEYSSSVPFRRLKLKSISHNNKKMFGLSHSSWGSISITPPEIYYESTDGPQDYSSASCRIEFKSRFLKAFTFGDRIPSKRIGLMSVSFGSKNVVSGDFSMAIGRNLTISGNNSLVIGNNTGLGQSNSLSIVNLDRGSNNAASFIIRNEVKGDFYKASIDQDGISIRFKDPDFEPDVRSIEDNSKFINSYYLTPEVDTQFYIISEEKFKSGSIDNNRVYGIIKTAYFNDYRVRPQKKRQGYRIFIGADYNDTRYLQIDGNIDYSELDVEPYLLLKNGNLKLSGTIDAKITTFNYNSFTYGTGFTYYATSGVEAPTAYKFGRMVTLTGAYKTSSAQSSTGQKYIGKVPAGCEPIQQFRIVEQGSGQNRYLLQIRPDGNMYAERYGVASDTAIPNGVWLNISATYISKG